MERGKLNDESIWLTGAGGFIGSHLVPRLCEVTPVLRCITNTKSGAADRYFVDYSSADSIRAAISKLGVPNVLIHLGWGAMEDAESDVHLTTNVCEAKSLIDTMYAAGLKKVVFIGSVNEYGARTGLLVEDQPAEGRMTKYAVGKAAVTAHGLAQACALGRSFVSIRVYNTFGAGQRAGSLINKLFRCQRDGVKADLGPCEHFRDYIYVEDVAEGIARLCDVSAPVIVNLGSGRSTKLRDFVEMFWRELGGKPEDLVIGANPMRAGEPEQPQAWASLERLERLTGWRPERTLEDGIRLTVKRLREN